MGHKPLHQAGEITALKLSSGRVRKLKSARCGNIFWFFFNKAIISLALEGITLPYVYYFTILVHLSCLNYRFNLGFEPAIIRSQQPLRLYEWHAVLLSRDEKEGNLTIDGKPPVTGFSKGSSTGLNLNQNLHVGGVPDFSAISALSGFKSGFIGCLSYLAIDGKVAGLGKIFQCYLRRVMNCVSFYE